ncbi:MAG TPA: hypothetical protein VH349_19525 [Ktedonobacterales bacterium]|jgi:hypothetical protein
MIIFWLAALGATIVTAILVGLVYLFSRKQRPEPRDLLLWAAALWIFNLILDLIILYYVLPPMTGPYWGGQWLIWPLILSGVFALFGGGFRQIRATIESLTERINAEGAIRRGGKGSRDWVDERPAKSGQTQRIQVGAQVGVTAIVIGLLFATVVNGLIAIGTTWFDGNAKALASIPVIKTAPASAQLPPTDINHIVLVSQGVAANLGQRSLASTGQNLGSQYHTDEASYTLQSVQGHLCWIAPLVYNNVWANVGNWESPGYVQVDAEDPNAQATLHTGFHMRYLPDAILNQDLLRHVYLSGYTGANLADPTLEVDDSGTPYFTISLMTPTRGFTGEVVDKVLLVDPQSGAIKEYAVKDVPAWVDRIMPSSLVDNYLAWWGLYHDAPWFNPSGAKQQKPVGGIELLYNTAEQPVWLVMMSSNAQTDRSSTGVVLFNTRENAGTLYPLTGIGVSDDVVKTITSNPSNIRNYGVGSLQLYQIYGEPTWVATFVRDSDIGQIFQGVGIVDARHLTGNNVIMASTKSAALAQYAQWLAGNNTQGQGPTATAKKVDVEGKVERISSAIQDGTTVYYLLLEGQQRIFLASLNLSAKLPLVQPGDQVKVTYLDTGQGVETLTAFDDLSIHANGPAPSPTP